MSLWKRHTEIIFRSNDDDDDDNNDGKEDINTAAITRNSLLTLYNHSLQRMSNGSSKLLLEPKLYEYSQIISDSSKTNSINNFAKPINNLLKGKVSTRHCVNWKSKLSDYSSDALNILKSNLKESNYCNTETGCKANTITQSNIDWLFNTKNDRTTSYPKPKAIEKENKAPYKNEPATSSNFYNYNSISKPSSSTTPSNSFTKTNNDTKRIVPNFSNNSKGFTKKTSNFNIPKLPEEEIPKETSNKPEHFRTARTEYNIQNKKKFGNNNGPQSYRPIENNPVIKRSLGTTRSSVQSKFIPPIPNNKQEEEEVNDTEEVECEDERLKHIDPKMVELIRSEIIDTSAPVEWDDIAGLDFAKAAIQEAVVWPLLRPDIFTGLRRPPKGILLFGPPGTGKTLIGKCIASQCCATFFSISASSLTSKWIGDGEKMVRALFAVARCHQPAVVFIDEIDSLLIQRSDAEHEATRRIKTEFLVQLDGAATADEDRLLVIGATNRPQELDEAARRRMVKRLYIPLPDLQARIHLINRLMRTERHSLTEEDVTNVAELANGFSGADMRSLCSEAALGPIRSLPFSQITNISNEQVRPVTSEDFKNALIRVRPSVSSKDLEHYVKWDLTYGSGSNVK